MAHLAARNFGLLSDCDVLALQNVFLTSGYHTFSTSNIDRSRELICSMLSSIPTFSSVACLTLGDGPLPEGVAHLYHELITHTDLSSESIDDFLLNAFYCDFLWIESSPSLLASLWFDHFRQRLCDFNLLRSLSVLTLNIS